MAHLRYLFDMSSSWFIHQASDDVTRYLLENEVAQLNAKCEEGSWRMRSNFPPRPSLQALPLVASQANASRVKRD
jgi:hypothetical protein